MNSLKRQFLLELFRIFDLGVCAFAFLFATIVTRMPDSVSGIRELISVRISVANILIFVMLVSGWHINFIVLGYYDSRRLSMLRHEIIGVFKGTVISSLVVFIVSLVYPIGIINTQFVLYFAAALFITLSASRVILRIILKQLRLVGFNLRHLVVVGTNQKALKFAQKIKNEPELGYVFKGFVDTCWNDESTEKSNFKILSDFLGFKNYLRNNIVDEVIICLPVDHYYHEIEEVISACSEQGILVRVNNDILKVNGDYPKVEYVGNEMLLTYTTGQMRRRLLVFKKVFDFCTALTLLLITSPIMLLSALAIKLTSSGPVFFTQERLGFNKRRFKIYKFRTMVPDAEKKIKELEHLNEMKGAAFKLKDDPRITPVGKFLRKLSLDELPQLINVLKGDMSLVGPRPLPERDFNGFNTDWHRRRFCVKPGLTCLWQISGRNNITFDEWMALDMAYIDNWSPMLDMKILLKTVPAVISGHGAS